MQVVKSNQAPEPVGPYSQAVSAGGVLYLSGQIALDPKTGNMVTGSVGIEIEQVFKNLEQVLVAGGSDLQHVLRATVLLTNMDDFPIVNAYYAKVFAANKVMPARTTFAVAALPKGALVEVDCVALKLSTRVSLEEMANAIPAPAHTGGETSFHEARKAS